MSMKQVFFLLICSFFAISSVYAQKKLPTDTLTAKVAQARLRQTSNTAKPYYADIQTAQTCETWNSCAKWAAKQYEQDPSFKIIKAQFVTQRTVYRHSVAKETHLFVEATTANRTVYLEFTTPTNSGRTRPYNYIVKFHR